jgi:hypothetical protein
LGFVKIDRRTAVVVAIAIAGTLLAAYLIWPSGEEEETLAEQAALTYEDLEGQGWSFGEGSDTYPDLGNYSSHYQIGLFKTAEPGSIRVLVVVKAYNTSALCEEEFHANYLTFAGKNGTAPLDAGDEGFISWHNSGNGSCVLCFRQDYLMVWMDVTTNYGANPAWEDDDIYQEVAVLIETQSEKISGLLG